MARHMQTHYRYNHVKHTISFDAASSTKQTNPISDQVFVIRLNPSADCYVVFEDELDASSTIGLTLEAGVIEYFAVDQGQKLSARGVSGAGTLEITEFTL